jgi:hypothetical protein
MKNINLVTATLGISLFPIIPVLSVPDHEVKTQCFSIKDLSLVGQYYYSSSFTRFPCRIIHGSGSGSAIWQITANGNNFSYSRSNNDYYVNGKKRTGFNISYRSSMSGSGRWQIPTELKENEIMQREFQNSSGSSNTSGNRYWCFLERV